MGYYWQRYDLLLEDKEILEDYLTKLEDEWKECTEEYKEIDELVLDILDIQRYIEKAEETIEQKYNKIVMEARGI